LPGAASVKQRCRPPLALALSQAKEALRTEERVKQQLDAAAAVAAQQRQAAEASSQ